MLVKIKNGRVAFPNLFEARSFQGEGDPAYSASIILEKTNPSIKEIEKTIIAVAKEKWGDKSAAMLKDLKAKDKLPLHDGDSKTEYEGFPGNVYVSARNKSRPLVIDRDKTPLTKEDGRPYGGAICNVNVDIWAQENQFGKRINATLVGVQFVKDADAFSGAAPATVEDFDAVGDEAEESLV
jgi:hypothetical protein